jgi:hypothetical protein
MSDEIRSGLLHEVKDLEPRVLGATGDAKDAGSPEADRTKGDTDGTDGADADGTDGGDTDASDSADADGTDSADADATDGDSDGTDKA